MRTHLRPLIGIAVAVVSLGTVLASSAAADELFVDDPSADTYDTFTRSFTLDSDADIQDVTVVNEPDSLVVYVNVGTVVSFPVDLLDTSDADFELEVSFTDPTDTARQPMVLRVSNLGTMTLEQRLTGDEICDFRLGESSVEVDETDDVYVLTLPTHCAEALPRTLQVSVVITHHDGTTEAQDVAPDTGRSASVSSSPSGATVRLAGLDRMLTAIQLSADDFGDGEASAVVLASAYSFPDALAGGPLAFYAEAPMLLTPTDSLDSRTLAEIRRVLPAGETVYVLGGTAAISDRVLDQLRTAGYTPERLAGVDRFETAIAIADYLGAGRDSVLIADGRSFTDALVASAAAPGVLGVLVLTDGDVLPPATRDFLRSATSDQLAIGEAAATAVGPSIDAITGATPAELSVHVAEDLVVPRGALAVASQDSYPDSLAGGPHIARRGGALLLTDPGTLSTETGDLVRDMSGRLRQVFVYGGTAAVSQTVLDQIEAAL